MSRWPLRRRVVAQLTDGHAVAGVMWRKRGPLLELRDASLHAPGSDGPAPMDGAVLIERSKVLWLQIVEGGG